MGKDSMRPGEGMIRAVGLVTLFLLFLGMNCAREQNPDARKSSSETDANALVRTEDEISRETGDSTRYIFRKTHWGMTPQEVIASEGAKPRLKDETFLIYATTYNGHPAEITYYFDKGLLGMAEYSISGPGMQMRDYLDIYTALHKKMIQRYGKPSLDDIGNGESGRVVIGNSFVYRKTATLWNRLANWELHAQSTEVLLYLGYSTAADDSSKSCDVQYKSNSFNIENLTGGSR